LIGQITRIRPLRCTILHFWQIFLTDALTFISNQKALNNPAAPLFIHGTPHSADRRMQGGYLARAIKLLTASDYSASVIIVLAHLHGYFVARQNSDKIHSHPARQMSQNFPTILQFYLKSGVWQGFRDNPEFACFLFR